MQLHLQGLTKHYPGVAALDGIDLDIASGELVALLGPSGSGKTTLLRVIGGLLHADHGSVLFDDVDATRLSLRERNVGFVFQHYALFRHMTVAENIAFGLRSRPRARRPDKATINKRVQELLQLVQLPEHGGRYPDQLSGGQKQRIALARALAIDPSVLLLDEPFGALDAKVRVELRRWLRKLHERTGQTTLFVTHDQEEALEVADRVVLMNAGRVEQIGTPAEVYDQPATPFVHRFLGNVNLFHGRVSGHGLGIGDQTLASAIPTHLDQGSAAVAYVRPHELELLPEASPQGLKARVERLLPMGSRIRVELRGEDGLNGALFEAELSKEMVQSLQPGQTVRLSARQSQIYPDYEI